MKVAVAPTQLALAPGDEARFEVTIVNDADQTLAPTLTITGVDPEHLGLPDHLEILAPADASTVAVTMTIPPDAVPGQLRVGFQVADPDGWQQPRSATVVVQVGDRPPVSIETTPSMVRARRSAAFMTVLHNRSDEAVDLTLDAEVDADLEVRFLSDRVRLGPDEELEVPTEIAAQDRT